MAYWSCPPLSTSWSRPCRSALLYLTYPLVSCFVNHQEQHGTLYRLWEKSFGCLLSHTEESLHSAYANFFIQPQVHSFAFNPHLALRCRLHNCRTLPVCLLYAHMEGICLIPSLLQCAACSNVSRKRAYCHGFMTVTAGLAGQASSTGADAAAAARHQRPLQRLPLCEHAVRAA